MATSVPRHRHDPVALAFAPRRDDPRPLGVQLADAVREAASDGRLHVGDRLPSTRELARRLGLSRTVTAAAYDQLGAEGWLSSRHGSGTFVATSPSVVVPAGTRASAGVAVDLLEVDGEPAAGRGIDLRPGRAWMKGIDTAAWRRAWRAAGHVVPAPHRSVAGCTAYREAVAEHLLRHRGLPVPDPLAPDGVLATAGTSAALVEIAAAVLRPGDAVAVEDPGWPRVVACLRAADVDVVPVRVDEHGLVPERIPTGVRAVVCTPAHQYPLGARMPAQRRVALIELARRHGWLVVEDDYDGELRFDVAPPPLLAALAPDVVVHLGTVSKILSPTLGSGWMVAAPPVAEQVLARRAATAPGLSEAGQLVVAELARSGDLSRHLRRVRRELSARRHRVVAALDAAGITVPGDDAGAHVVVPLASADAEWRIVGQAAEQGVLVDGLGRYHVAAGDEGRRHGVLVGYAVDGAAELTRAVGVLIAVLAE